ncbi:hypothetical protein DESC_240084 [Desulfosarcina cetonica]|nr:hypothetical protein DESC_240084 [Desulfosarcina cetonica]
MGGCDAYCQSGMGNGAVELQSERNSRIVRHIVYQGMRLPYAGYRIGWKTGENCITYTRLKRENQERNLVDVTLLWHYFEINFLIWLIIWRKCMGIEPTRDGISAPHRI